MGTILTSGKFKDTFNKLDSHKSTGQEKMSIIADQVNSLDKQVTSLQTDNVKIRAELAKAPVTTEPTAPVTVGVPVSKKPLTVK